MKTGKWTERDPIDRLTWREILARDVAAQMRALEESHRPYVVETVLAPVVSARAPRGPEEFAGYGGKQAAGLGRLAAGRGMDVAPYYWKSGAGIEGCAVKAYRPTLALVATWQRKVRGPRDRGWLFDIAYCWNPGDRSRGPVKMKLAALEEIVRAR